MNKVILKMKEGKTTGDNKIKVSRKNPKVLIKKSPGNVDRSW